MLRKVCKAYRIRCKNVQQAGLLTGIMFACFCLQNGGCADCPIGRYLAGGSVSPSNCELCPAGTYGAVEGLNSASCSGNCLRGYYCPAGSTSATQFRCPAGKYGSTTGLQDSACSGACSPGFYCEAGSTSSQDKPCSAGRYGGPQQQTADCAGPCEAGYFCTAGSSSSKQVRDPLRPILFFNCRLTFS